MKTADKRNFEAMLGQHALTPEEKAKNGFVRLTAKDLDRLGLYRKIPFGLLYEKTLPGDAVVQHKSVWPEDVGEE